MNFPNGNPPKILQGHLTPMPSKAKRNEEIAASLEELARSAATDQVREVVEWYFAQIPELVARMLAQAFAANGLEFKPPPPRDEPQPEESPE